MKDIDFLVVGSSGFIGSNLTSFLRASGITYVTLNRPRITDDKLNNDLNINLISDFVYDDLRVTLNWLQPKTILCMIGGKSVGHASKYPLEDYNSSVTSCLNLLEWVRLISPESKVILASSAAVYGNAHDRPISEHAKSEPHSHYGLHKTLIESIASFYSRTYGIHIAVARLFSVYGPGLFKQLPWELCQKFNAQKEVITLGGTGNEKRDWIYIDDAVSLLMRIEFSGKSKYEVYNIGSGISNTVRDFTSYFAKAWATEYSIPIPIITFSGSSRPGDPLSLLSNSSKIIQNNHMFIDLDSGAERYVQWFKTVS